MNTIFRKQLILYLGTLIISLGLLGIILSQVISSYFIDQREAELLGASSRVSAALEGLFEYGIVYSPHLQQEISDISRFLDARLIVISSDYHVVIGNVQVLTATLTDFWTPLYHQDLLPLMDGYPIVSYGNLDGLFIESLLTVGRPIWVGEQIVGAVLVGTSMTELEATIAEMYRLTVLCLVAAALVGGILTYISSKAISRPLRQMNEAARVIADGDFEKRIVVQSKLAMDEVGQLSKSFNNMAESLQEQERVRRTFVANLSHDIRSPLTSMRGFLQAINDGTAPEEKIHRYLGIVMDETDRLIKLANNLLDLNLLNETILKPTNFDINDLIRKTALSFESQATDKNLKLHCRFEHESDMVRADYDKIQRVLYNLMENAAKFVQHNGEIIVETNLKGDFVYVSVQDNGPGISEEDQGKIFERFYKADSSRGADKRGSGLGLSIVKDIVRAHGGSIEVQSMEGDGSLFSFSIPKGEEN